MSNALKAKVGKTATIVGTAYNARAGAIVELDDRTPVYLAGLEEWDDAFDGVKVSVSGELKRRQLVPQAVRAADGSMSHGMDDDAVYVIEDPTWTALD